MLNFAPYFACALPFTYSPVSYYLAMLRLLSTCTIGIIRLLGCISLENIFVIRKNKCWLERAIGDSEPKKCFPTEKQGYTVPLLFHLLTEKATTETRSKPFCLVPLFVCSSCFCPCFIQLYTKNKPFRVILSPSPFFCPFCTRQNLFFSFRFPSLRAISFSFYSFFLCSFILLPFLLLCFSMLLQTVDGLIACVYAWAHARAFLYVETFLKVCFFLLPLFASFRVSSRR